MKKITFYFLALFTMLSAQAQMFTSGILNYNIESTPNLTVVVTGRASTSTATNITIPPTVVYNGQTYTVTRIQGLAFQSNQLTSVTIPNTVKEIGGSAFYDNLLTAIVLPTSLTIINFGTFRKNKLTTVTIPNTVKFIDGYAFYDNLLTTVVIPNSVTTIQYNAFMNNKLASVTLPNSLTFLGDGVFTNNLLTTIVIPNSVQNIGESCFSGNLLTTYSLPNNITSIPNFLFYLNKLTTVTIPNSVTTIGDHAFSNNQLTTVTIPNSVLTFSTTSAFGNNPTLTNVFIEKSTPIAININVFYNINLANATLTVPVGAKTAYQNAAVWQNFGTIKEASTLATNNFDSTNTIHVSNTNNSLNLDAIGTVQLIKTSIYDVSGHTVLSSTQPNIDISGLASGVYLLQIQTNNGVLIEKIIK